MLWEAAQRLSPRLLAGGSREQDREDLCATAIQQFVTGLVSGRPDSLNQLATWDDCLNMVRHILRLRASSFHSLGDMRESRLRS